MNVVCGKLEMIISAPAVNVQQSLKLSVLQYVKFVFQHSVHNDLDLLVVNSMILNSNFPFFCGLFF